MQKPLLSPIQKELDEIEMSSLQALDSHNFRELANLAEKGKKINPRLDQAKKFYAILEESGDGAMKNDPLYKKVSENTITE